MTRHVYITCPITRNQDKLLFINKIAEILKETGWIPILPDTKLEARQLFDRDVKYLNRCSFIVAEYSNPSHGVGVETGFAYVKDILIIGFIEKGRKASRMIVGAPHIRLIEYESEEDALNKFKHELKNLVELK